MAVPLDPRRPFVWRDGERTVAFGQGALEHAGELLGAGYTLLSTPRAAAAAPALADRAAAVHHVGAGRVDELAGDLLEAVGGASVLVGLGGGRVIDVAKALAAATGARAAAVPTTLSGAEMTAVHRQARGADPATPFIRPAVVLNDPALSASQPEAELLASVLNALGHVAEAPLTVRATPVATLAALAAGGLLVGAIPAGGTPDRDALALGGLLAGYGIDQAGYGLHHVLSQTLARFAGVAHGAANAVMLPHSLAALRTRAPAALDALDEALGGPAELVTAALAARAGTTRLRDLGVEQADLAHCAAQAAARPQLAHTPPAADEREIARLYEQAF